MPLHDDDARGPLAALPDGQQRAHLQGLELVLVEHLDLEAGAGEIAHALGELDRTQHVGRLVDEVAGEEHALGHRLARGEGLGGGVGLGAQDDELAQAVALLVLAAVLGLALCGIS